MPVPPTYRGATTSSTTRSTTGLGELGWKQVFTDPVLQRLIESARLHNPDVAIAAARVDVVRAETESLRAEYGPQITAQANETLQRISPIGLPKNRTTGNPAGSANIFGAQATWEIDFWGKYRRASEAARANLLASEAAQNAVLVTLVAQVARAYFDLRTLDRQLELEQQRRAVMQQATALVQQELEQGVVRREDVDAARSQLLQFDQQIQRLQRDIAAEENQLSLLTGSEPASVPRGLAIAQQAVPPVDAGVPSALLERRPDLRQAEEALIAANAEIGVAEAAYLPNISLTAQGGQESTAFHSLLTQNADTWLLQPSLNLPIFTAGRIRAQVHLAKAQQQILVHAYQGAVLAALRDVSDALASANAAHATLEEQRQILELEQRAESLATQRLTQGVSGAPELDRARAAVLTAQLTLAGAEEQRLLSVVQLFESLGGGWKEDAAPPSR